MMRARIGFQSSLMLAVLLHAGIFFLFTFTFAVPKISSRPVLVFLGSFLHAEDVAPLTAQSAAHAGFDIRRLNLDSSLGSWPHQNVKPSLVQKTSPDERKQFKPLVAEPITPPKSSPATASDMGIELEPMPPVKLKIQPQ